MEKCKQYKPLPIDFEIIEDLQDIIDEYINTLNSGDMTSKDYYETEIQLILNYCKRENKLTADQIQKLRDYYEFGGIFTGDENGTNN